MNPKEHTWGLSELLIAEAVDALAVANWQRGAGKRADYPKPIPRPGVRDDTERFGSEAIPIDDMAEFLGWT